MSVNVVFWINQTVYMLQWYSLFWLFLSTSPELFFGGLKAWWIAYEFLPLHPLLKNEIRYMPNRAKIFGACNHDYTTWCSHADWCHPQPCLSPPIECLSKRKNAERLARNESTHLSFLLKQKSKRNLRRLDHDVWGNMLNITDLYRTKNACAQDTCFKIY